MNCILDILIKMCCAQICCCCETTLFHLIFTFPNAPRFPALRSAQCKQTHTAIHFHFIGHLNIADGGGEGRGNGVRKILYVRGEII